MTPILQRQQDLPLDVLGRAMEAYYGGRAECRIRHQEVPILRGLEEEGIVTSEWLADVPGPAKRVYRLTDSGRRLLDQWAEALRETQGVMTTFLNRYEQGEGR